MDIEQLLIYVIVGSLGIAWLVAVWKTSGILSIILPVVTYCCYLLRLGSEYFAWYSVADFFYYLTLFLGLICFLVFFAPIFSGLANESKKVTKASRINDEQTRLANHYYFHNPNSTYNRYINPHSPTYKK